jgi:hypothetical protein
MFQSDMTILKCYTNAWKSAFYNVLHTWAYINVLWYNANLTFVKIKIEIKIKITYFARLTF